MNRCDIPTVLDEARLRAILPRANPRDRLLVELGWETGLRISELLGLRVGQVWFNGRPVSVLRVQRSALKGGRGVRARSVSGRVIPLNDRARAVISDSLGAELQLSPHAPLFPSREGEGRAITRRQATRIIKRIFLAAGLDPCRVWAGHSLRKRYVRRIYELSGHDINLARAAVAHRYVATTQAYIGLDEEGATEVILRLGTLGPVACAGAVAGGVACTAEL